MLRYSSILRQLQTSQSTALRLGPVNGWCSPGLFPAAFNQQGQIRPGYYQEMARHYPYLNFDGIMLQNHFGLPANDVLQKIILSKTFLSSLANCLILKDCKALTHLDLSFNHLGNPASMFMLGAICQARKNTLEELDLEGINLAHAEWEFIDTLIADESVLQSLCLSDCSVTNDQAASLAYNLRVKKPPLRKISMTDNPDIKPARLLQILEALTAGQQIREINFQGCRPFHSRHREPVLQAIISMPSLRCLELPRHTPLDIRVDVQALLQTRASGFFKPASRVLINDSDANPGPNYK